ncbi:MAG: hypothetical protein HY904_00605 [Deltaproteobacteria bacterium]|nr:hypothetical protein [Deltaproteobacteria bacterium]
MSKQAPLAQMKAQFGSKEKLAAQLASMMDVPEGVTREQLQKRLQRLSNARLLQLKKVEDEFKTRFGGKRESATAAAIERRELSGKAADSFRDKAEKLSRAQLLDLAGPARKARKNAAK